MLHKLNGDTFEKVDENYNAKVEEAATLTEEKESFEQKIEEHEATIATLQQEKDAVGEELEKANETYEAAQSTIQTLTEENEALAEFKAQVVLKEKEAVLDHYTTLLDAEVIAPFKERLEEMTKEELDKELAYVLVQTQPTLFTNRENDPGFVPKDDPIITGIEGILMKYKNK